MAYVVVVVQKDLSVARSGYRTEDQCEKSVVHHARNVRPTHPDILFYITFTPEKLTYEKPTT